MPEDKPIEWEKNGKNNKPRKPTPKEGFWANHTPAARKLTCSRCGHRGFCVEVWGGEGK